MGTDKTRCEECKSDPMHPGLCVPSGVSTVGHDTARELAEFVGGRGPTGPSTPIEVARIDAALSHGYTVGRRDGMSSVLAEAMLADAVRTDAPRAHALPQDSAERKRTPLCTGLLDYFPASLAALADHIAGIGCIGDPCGDLVEALRDRNWGEVCVHALCDLDAELAAGPDACGDLENVVSLGDLFTEFASALAAVAQVSWHGNEKHNPGQPLHHARGKSADHEDCIARHHVERGGFDGPMRHSACKLWRALAAWQEQLEAGGAPKARGAR